MHYMCAIVIGMKKKQTTYIPRNQFLVDGHIQTQVKGTKRGKKGYTRKNKSWKKEIY